MIQRIQSLYLLAASALMAVTLFAPLAWFGNEGSMVTLYAFDLRQEYGAQVSDEAVADVVAEVAAQAALLSQTEEVADSDVQEAEQEGFNAAAAEPAPEKTPMPIYLGILLVLSTLLPFITIFLFKNRMLQVRLCGVEGVFLMGALVMLTYTFFKMGSQVESYGMKVAMVLPVLALFLVFLAGRAIFRDELLLRSLNRIR